MLATSLLTAMLLAAAPDVGQTAPDFTAVDTDGKTHTLSEAVKEGPVVLAFFPRAFTMGCTQEIKNYVAQAPALEQSKARLLAISTDKPEDLKRFKSELKAPFAFVADPDAKLVTLYDVKGWRGTRASRVTFVVGPERKVLSVERGISAIDPDETLKACALPAAPAK